MSWELIEKVSLTIICISLMIIMTIALIKGLEDTSDQKSINEEQTEEGRESR